MWRVLSKCSAAVLLMWCCATPALAQSQLPSAEALMADDSVDSPETRMDTLRLEPEAVEALGTPPPLALPLAASDDVSDAPPQARPISAEAPQGAALSWHLVRDLFEEFQAREQGESLDLSFHHEDLRWLDVASRLEAGDCKASLKLAQALSPEGPTSQEEVHYLWARLALCSGDATQGRAAMTALLAAESLGVRWLAARALGKKLPSLRKPAPSATAPGEPWRLALNDAQSLSKRADDPANLEQTLLRLDEALAIAPDTSSRVQVLRWRAQLLEGRQQLDSAGRTLLGIRQMTRRWRSASDFEAALKAFERRHKRSVLALEDQLEDLFASVDARDYRASRTSLQALAKGEQITGKELQGWELVRQAWQAERERSREDAAALFARAEPMIAHPAMRPHLYMGWARALRRLNRDPEAIKLYQRLCDELPQAPLCADALYQAGRLLQYDNQHEQAYEHFFAFAGRFPEHEELPEALWRAAFSAYMLKRYDESQAAWSALKTRFPHHKDASDLTLGLKADYWLAMVALRRGELELAATRFQKTIDAGPLTWYGQLASSRLKQMGRQPIMALPARRLSTEAQRLLTGLHIAADERLAPVVTLARLGLYGEAEALVRPLLQTSPPVRGAGRILAALRVAQGSPDQGHWLARQYIQQTGPTRESWRDWVTAYPSDYMDLAHVYGHRFGVSPFLVLAIIRQESGFRPAVKSHAGALGLMQLMPATARYTARAFLGEDRTLNRPQIVEPDTNVRLGSLYIRLHTAHASDHVALALAGYNAGPAPLKRWLGQFADRELDAWVESITYREARGYVRKVMTSFFVYAALYGDGPLPELPLTLPATLRGWGDVPELRREQASAPVSLRSP